MMRGAAIVWLSPLRRAVIFIAFGAALLRAHEAQLYAALPFPKGFLAPPLILSCAPYVVSVMLACTRHQAAAVAFALSAAVLDLLAHYLVYGRLYVPHRFDMRGWPVYFLPAFSLAVVGPIAAFIAWLVERRAAKRRAARP